MYFQLFLVLDFQQGRRMPGEMVDVLAEKTVSSGQAVLGVIGQLKRNALLSDFPAQNAAVKQRREVGAISLQGRGVG